MRETRPTTRTSAITWLSPIAPMVVMFAGYSGFSWAKGALGFGAFSPAVSSGLAALVTILWIGGGVRRSTGRHRIALAVGAVGVIVLPAIALYLLPTAQRHQWLPVAVASLAAATIAVYAYVAVTRLNGFGPPELPGEEPVIPVPAAADRPAS
jgi:hypothetical protein